MEQELSSEKNSKKSMKGSRSEFCGILDKYAESKLTLTISKFSRPAFLSFIILLPVCLLWEGIKISTLGNIPININIIDKFLSTILGLFLFMFILTVTSKSFFSIVKNAKIAKVWFVWILFFIPMLLMLISKDGYLLSAKSFLYAAAGDSARSFSAFSQLIESNPFLPSIPMNFIVTSFFYDWKDIVKVASSYVDITSLIILLVSVLILSANAFYFNFFNKRFTVFCMILSAFGIIFSLTVGVLPSEEWRQSRNIIIIENTLLTIFIFGLTFLYDTVRNEALTLLCGNIETNDNGEYSAESLLKREDVFNKWLPPNSVTFFVLLVLAGPVVMLIL